MKNRIKLKKQDFNIPSGAIDIMKAIGCETETSLFVGGFVRDTVLKHRNDTQSLALKTSDLPIDIDIATKLTPEQAIEALDKKKIKNIPTGIKHGTITAVCKNCACEITTLRQDVQTDGRHAEVQYCDSWEQDARRRDFTMNTLLADLEGNIYDPTGDGLNDLLQGKIVFVGDAAARVKEDYLRILRYFRFYTFYSNSEPDTDVLETLRNNAEGISSLSAERITSEFLKILSHPRAADTIRLMSEYEILNKIILQGCNIDRLSELCHRQLETKTISHSVAARLYALFGKRTISASNSRLKLTNSTKNELKQLDLSTQAYTDNPQTEPEKMVYKFGREISMQAVLLATQNPSEVEHKLKEIENTDIIKFPIRGKDLIEMGYSSGKDLGDKLERTENWWLENKCSPSKEDCINYIKMLK